MTEYSRGDTTGRIPMNNQMQEQLKTAKTNDIVNILRRNIMITPDDADRAAREIEELRAEAERLRKQLRRNNRYDIAPPYKTHKKWTEMVEYDADIAEELQAYAHTIWNDGDTHNLIARAIAEITYLRQRVDRLDLPY